MSMNLPQSIAILLAILAASPAHAAFVTERSFSSPDGKLAFTLERDETATTLSKVRIDTTEIKRSHVIARPVAARNGFTAILTPR